MVEYSFLIFGSLFAIVDPFAAIPTFLAITSNESTARRKHIAKTACIVCAGVMATFALLGSAVFRLFGITLTAFQIAGGLVLMLSALDMLRAQKSSLKETPEELAEGIGKNDVAITPLAVPLLAGPGAITTSIVLAARASTLAQKAVLIVLIGVVSAVSYLTLVIAAENAKNLSPTLLNIITRLMGLFLAAIGVQFILTAIKTL